MSRVRDRRIVAALLAALLTLGVPAAGLAGAASTTGGSVGPSREESEVAALLFPKPDIAALRARGREVLPTLASIYLRSDEAHRAVIAYAFYQLGWKSAAAKTVLMRDVHTHHRDLRLHVQWALGRVSNDDDVVDALLNNMQHDSSPLFRNKAACALASDQIHLSAEQRFDLVSRLVASLRDPKLQVRIIALQVLRTHTGQTKGFDPNGAPAAREVTIREWEEWLEVYRSNL